MPGFSQANDSEAPFRSTWSSVVLRTGDFRTQSTVAAHSGPLPLLLPPPILAFCVAGPGGGETQKRKSSAGAREHLTSRNGWGGSAKVKVPRGWRPMPPRSVGDGMFLPLSGLLLQSHPARTVAAKAGVGRGSNADRLGYLTFFATAKKIKGRVRASDFHRGDRPRRGTPPVRNPQESRRKKLKELGQKRKP